MTFLGVFIFMKYIISESRFENLIMNFLDDRFKGMKKHVEHLADRNYTWWGIGNYGMLDKSTNDDGVVGVGVNIEIWNSLRGTFDLSPTQTDEYITMWVEENLGIFPHEIWTF